MTMHHSIFVLTVLCGSGTWTYQEKDKSKINSIDMRFLRLLNGKTLMNKMMGDTGAMNGMAYCRGNAEDFNNWATLGNSGWSYKDLLLYFIKSEDNGDKEIVEHNPEYHGIGGYQRVERFRYQDLNAKIILEAGKQLGYKIVDVTGKDQLGTMIMQTITKDGQPKSTNSAFIQPIRNASLKSAKVAYAKKEVISSTGTVSSPKLLMLFGIGPADDLKKLGIKVVAASPVGKNVQDHVTFNGVSLQLNEKTATEKSFKSKQEDSELYLKTHTGPLSSTGAATLSLFTQTKYAEIDGAPDDQIYFISKSTADIDIFKVHSYYDTLLVYLFVLGSKSKGYLKLNKTDPIWGNPFIYPGTCKMGPKEDPGAVVDPRLKVYGVPGLRVVDAAIMPHNIRGNPHATIMAIAEKAADMIKEDWCHH
ncbi:oxygen-dependent choline dehydrogenase-like [Belonocnema kinseyi]|uniref:oxygen-dependent choline dehydrogenase-like n=1 Tax=Belonocnema kinseyi TaxID=2817044 RepID=UPI00143DE55B|nr:oxygen-dependent choline dehydrogenase-like [Belonocnema kinseyi]